MLTSHTYAPKLRRGLAAQPNRRGFVLHDLRRAGQPVHLSPAALELVKLFDGTVTLGELSAATDLAVADIAALVTGLDEALLLDGPSWQAKITAPVREPVCIGVYPDDAESTRRLIRSLFVGKDGVGEPTPGHCVPGSKLRAVLVPHMDYTRGNVTYGHGFRPLFEESAAKLFVVVGTSHYSPAPFTLSRQNFRTSLGVVPTDQPFIDRVVTHYGDGLFDDPAAHVPEHSIELELPFLQLLAEARREPIRIVPLLVGPINNDIPRMAEALAKAEAEAGEPVCYVISGDLAHIGPKFDDPELVNAEQLQHSREQDEKLLKCLEGADAAGYSKVITDEEDARRICGHSPTVLSLLAAKPTRGRVTHYQQHVHPQGQESVSFAAAAFYRHESHSCRAGEAELLAAAEPTTAKVSEVAPTEAPTTEVAEVTPTESTTTEVAEVPTAEAATTKVATTEPAAAEVTELTAAKPAVTELTTKPTPSDPELASAKPAAEAEVPPTKAATESATLETPAEPAALNAPAETTTEPTATAAEPEHLDRRSEDRHLDDADGVRTEAALNTAAVATDPATVAEVTPTVVSEVAAAKATAVAEVTATKATTSAEPAAVPKIPPAEPAVVSEVAPAVAEVAAVDAVVVPVDPAVHAPSVDAVVSTVIPVRPVVSTVAVVVPVRPVVHGRAEGRWWTARGQEAVAAVTAVQPRQAGGLGTDRRVEQR